MHIAWFFFWSRKLLLCFMIITSSWYNHLESTLCIAGCTQPTKFKESTNTLVLIMIATVVQKSALGNKNKPLASLQCKTYSSCSPCITLVRKLSCWCMYTSTFVLCELNIEYLTCRDEYYYLSIFEPCPRSMARAPLTDKWSLLWWCVDAHA